MNESQFTRKICKELAECGCLIFVAAGNRFGTAGWPDRHVITRDGKVFWLEFKNETREVTPLQTAILREINARRPKTGYVVRLPGTLEYAGECVASFDGTGKGLLKCLVG